MRTMLRTTLLAVVCLALACMTTDANDAKDKDKEKTEAKTVTTSSGLKYIDTKEGTGDKAQSGDTVVVHYTGKLKDGKVFDSSVTRNKPFELTIGKSRVIKGWTEGLQGMRVGGKRTLIIPADLGYGKDGSPPVIPPDAELTFDIELLKIR